MKEITNETFENIICCNAGGNTAYRNIYTCISRKQGVDPAMKADI